MLDPTTLTPDERRQLEERFWSRVDRRGPDDCWLWMFGKTSAGYGEIQFNKRAIHSHRLSYYLAHGSLPEGMFVCHSCDARYPVGDITYRRCCNPAHLWIGTPADNSADMANKGRAASGDRNGTHLYPERLARGLNNGAHRHPELMPRGERHGCARLGAKQVIEIRRLYAQGDIILKTIAERYGVALGHVHAIVTRKVWRHIP